jgi:hypothetical protein
MGGTLPSASHHVNIFFQKVRFAILQHPCQVALKNTLQETRGYAWSGFARAPGRGRPATAIMAIAPHFTPMENAEPTP